MNVVIVGGGTAGWITALFFLKTYPQHSLTVIESDEIGVLGAGEGTTPNFPHIMKSLDIPVSKLISECNATIKNGIKFTNWNPDRAFYYPFLAHAGLGEQAYLHRYGTNLPTYMSPILAAMNYQESFQYDLTTKISERGLVPLFDKGFSEPEDVISGCSVVTEWALHFDARKVASFLRSEAVARGATRVEGKVESVNADADGYITSLGTTAGNIPVDFVFDCTGFARLIIGKFFNAPWKSHSHMLPVNKAVPFFLPLSEQIPPYTESIAMDYGWMWKIPTQERFGCGYVFDDAHIDEDQALQEIEAFVGHEVDSPRTFSFDAGCYTTPWVNNCLAVGLSSGFIEPLEATSIWQWTKMLSRFLSTGVNLVSRNEESKCNFNKVYVDETNDVASFLYLHYVTKKKNSVFWRDFTKNNAMPDDVKSILSIVKERPIFDDIDYPSRLAFAGAGCTVILAGTEMASGEDMRSYQIQNCEEFLATYDRILQNQEQVLPMLLTHNALIDRVRGA
jgi:tryptophan halogenase